MHYAVQTCLFSQHSSKSSNSPIWTLNPWHISCFTHAATKYLTDRRGREGRFIQTQCSRTQTVITAGRHGGRGEAGVWGRSSLHFSQEAERNCCWCSARFPSLQDSRPSCFRLHHLGNLLQTCPEVCPRGDCRPCHKTGLTITVYLCHLHTGS